MQGFSQVLQMEVVEILLYSFTHSLHEFPTVMLRTILCGSGEKYAENKHLKI